MNALGFTLDQGYPLGMGKSACGRLTTWRSVVGPTAVAPRAGTEPTTALLPPVCINYATMSSAFLQHDQADRGKPDLVLINTPIHDYSVYPRFKASYSTPVGLVVLATMLRNNGYGVAIIDAEAYQLSPDEIVAEVVRLDPVACGVNAFSVNFELSRRLLQALPRKMVTILGGPHASLCSEEHLLRNFQGVDYIVRGDGEIPLLEIMAELSSPSTRRRRLLPSFRSEPTVDLDFLPIPDRACLANEPYTRGGLRFVDLTMSRGCVFRCAFCAGSCQSNGTQYRTRSLHLVREELILLRAEMAIEGIELVDDLPFASRSALVRFFDEVIDQLDFPLVLDFNLPLQFLKGLDLPLLERLASSGVRRMTFGIESGNEGVRRRMGKPVTDDQIRTVLRNLGSAGIDSKGYFVIGFPNETTSQVQETIDFAYDLAHDSTLGGKFSPRMFVFKPFPGSALWNQLLAEGHSEDDLLRFLDFELDREYFNKHAWTTASSFCELTSPELVGRVNDFYNSIGWDDSDGGHL